MEKNRHEYWAAYYAAHKDELTAKSRKWYADNREYAKAYQKKWQLENKDKIASANKRWRDNYPDKYYASRIRAAISFLKRNGYDISKEGEAV